MSKNSAYFVLWCVWIKPGYMVTFSCLKPVDVKQIGQYFCKVSFKLLGRSYLFGKNIKSLLNLLNPFYWYFRFPESESRNDWQHQGGSPDLESRGIFVAFSFSLVVITDITDLVWIGNLGFYFFLEHNFYFLKETNVSLWRFFAFHCENIVDHQNKVEWLGMWKHWDSYYIAQSISVHTPPNQCVQTI